MKCQFIKKNTVIIYYKKPKGVISAVADDKGRKVVTDLLPMVKERIYPVGRLDYDTSGILLLTNDGDFAQRLHIQNMKWIKFMSQK